MIDSPLTPRARAAVLAAMQAVEPVSYFAGVADSDPATFCELVGHVFSGEAIGALVLETLIDAKRGRE